MGQAAGLSNGVNPVGNSSRCDSKPSGALNPVRDLSLNGITPAGIILNGVKISIPPSVFCLLDISFQF
jgi:hypothetical protein